MPTRVGHLTTRHHWKDPDIPTFPGHQGAESHARLEITAIKSVTASLHQQMTTPFQALSISFDPGLRMCGVEAKPGAVMKRPASNNLITVLEPVFPLIASVHVV